MNSDQARLTHADLRTPRAAAVAGILFSVLLFAVFWLMRLSIPVSLWSCNTTSTRGSTFFINSHGTLPAVSVRC